ncbi:MAG: mechanosensitive ion channel family protein [Chloroflexota bacterium]|nr:mechanosensitive ion channel family protein [Chloroflexota bacterium]
MKRNRLIPILILSASLQLIFLIGCSSTISDQGQEHQLSPTTTLSQGALLATARADEDETQATPTPLLGDLVTERTPQPTITPGFLMQSIEEFAARRGFLYQKFMGIRLIDWINLALSGLIAFLGYLLGTWLIKRLLPRIVKRTSSTFDDALLEKIGPEVRWLVTILILRISVSGLAFIGDRFNQILRDIFYILTLSLIIWITWKVFDLAAEWISEKQKEDGREELTPVIEMAKNFIQILTIIIGITILLSYFGVNVTTLTAALGISGFAISLAAKDTISDAIAGLILIVDQPFRVGDRIEIQGVGTWGDVTEIGLRTTRIRTRDNRMVIVPNSIISNNQVVNYSYPDPRYRIQTHVYIPFEEDVDKIRELLKQAVRNVDGVLADKPVDALFIDMTEGPIKFRMRWWIESYVDTRRMFDQVH